MGQVSWALFDWANQPFFTIITTFIFAPYFANLMVSKVPAREPYYKVNITTQQGVKMSGSIPY